MKVLKIIIIILAFVLCLTVGVTYIVVEKTNMVSPAEIVIIFVFVVFITLGAVTAIKSVIGE